MTTLHQRLLATFQVEHAEHLNSIRALLAHLGAGAGAPPAAELDEIFRRAHTLKGAARAVDLRVVERLAHRLETLFSRVREGTLALDRPVIDVVHLVLNTTEDLAAATEAPPGLIDAAAALQTIERLLGIAPEPEPTPALAVPAAPAAAVLTATETVRVSTHDLDRLLGSASQLAAECLRQDVVTQHLAHLGAQVTAVKQDRDRDGAARGTDSGREQVQALSRQLRTLRRLQQSSAWQLHVLSEQLHQDVCRARLVPAESLFEGFPRMVRDLARDAGREVELRTVGLETRADRMVLQALKDPVMHLLRNSISHGIEPPEERRASSKGERGLLQLRLETRGRRLVLEVEDDGQGINLGRIREVAVEKGLLSPDQARVCSGEELARLVFEPGFSTSRLTTELSGRGMGLSVVRQAALRLQGEAEFVLRENRGVLVRVSVPLSVSTQHVVVVACRNQRFALPSHSVERLCRVRVPEMETVEGSAAVKIDGTLVPAFSLASLLDLGDTAAAGTNGVLSVLVLRSGTRRIAIAVDAFLDQREAVIKDLGRLAGASPKVLGGILLADGSVCVVLNPAELVTTSRSTDRPLNLADRKEAPEQKQPTILVVDDSLTTRTLEKSILEGQGYRVRLAVDGLDALRQLRLEPPALVITDLQMPRLDGYELVEEMKKDQQLAGIPVIVVTSLEKAEDRERGLGLGVDAYVVKKKFDQRELLEVIRQIL